MPTVETVVRPPGAVVQRPKPTVSPHRVASALLLAAITAGAVVTVGLWWQDTTYVYGLGGWLTNAGRLTGLLAGYTIVVLLFLMARVPYLEQRVGTDRLARWHAMGGRYTVSLAVSHAVLIIWGYAVTAHAGLTGETVTLLTSYPDVLMGTVALFLLVGVGVASARAARRRLSYETWHLIHLYTYLAIALAFSHQFATGADFVGPHGTAARVFWAALYVVVAALLLWYRVITPIRAAVRHRLRVAGVVVESRDTVSVYLTGRRLEDLAAQPGQFFRWRFLARGLWWAANPYSLSDVPRPGWLRITVKTLGRHSAALRALRQGTTVLAEGPYGSFTAAARRTRRKALLIAAGVGITSVRTLFESLPGGPGDVTLVYRAGTADDIVLRRELDEIARRRGAQVHYVVGHRRAKGPDLLAGERIAQLVPDLAHHDVYLCGPDALVATVRAGLRSVGVPAGNIHSESFAF